MKKIQSLSACNCNPLSPIFENYLDSDKLKISKLKLKKKGSGYQY